MKNFLIIILIAITQSIYAQGTKHLWSNNDNSVSIKVHFSGVDPGGAESFYFIIENNTSNDMKVSFNYTFVLSEVSTDCPHKSGSYNKVIGAKKTNNDGGYSGSISKAKMCSGGRPTSVLSWGVANVRTENMSLPKINQLVASANAKIKSRDFAAAQKYIDEASNLCNYCELQQSINTAQENLREEKLAVEQEKFEKEQKRISAKEEEERKELERKEKEEEKKDQLKEEDKSFEINDPSTKEMKSTEEDKPELIEKDKSPKEYTSTKKTEKKTEEKKASTIDYKSNEKYSLLLAINTILRTEQNNTNNFAKGDIVISGFKYYDYVDMVINWCDNYQAKWGYDNEIANYKTQINKYSQSMVLAESMGSVIDSSSRWELVGALGLQPTSLIKENPDTVYETYNLEFRFHFFPGWFKVIVGAGLGILDFPELKFSASKNNQPAFTEITNLDVDSEIKNFKIMAGFHQRVALNEDKTINLSFEQIGKLNFLSTGDKLAYNYNTANSIEIPLETRTDKGFLLDDFYSLSAGAGFDFIFPGKGDGSFGIGIYGNAAYYFYGQKKHKGEFEAEFEGSNFLTSYDFIIEEPKIKQFITSLSLRLFIDF